MSRRVIFRKRGPVKNKALLLPDLPYILPTGGNAMKKAKFLWRSIILAWGGLLNFAPQPMNHEFEIDTERNSLTSHFNAAWGYLGNAIESEKN